MELTKERAQNPNKSRESKKVLIIHPFLKYYGGAEYMLSQLLLEFPDADVFTFAFDKKILEKVGATNRKVISPFGDGILSHFYREFSLIYPSLIETYNFSNYDKIITLSYAYVHGLITEPGQEHISFILTPMRALWINRPHYGFTQVPLIKDLVNGILANQRLWDRAAAHRPDRLIAISQEVQRRVQSYWGLSSEIIYPPVDIEIFKPQEKVDKKDYYVTHSRLVAHKKVDLIIEAFKQLEKTLYVIGDGRDKSKLRNLAGNSDHIKFFDFVNEEEKIRLIQEAKGYIFAADEDFGISPVEAIAAGTPVLAYKAGGAKETVVENISGKFFEEQSVASLVSSFIEFERKIIDGAFKPEDMYKSVEKFSKSVFAQALENLENPS